MTKCERMVYGYILSLVPNWADADEILQETNIRLWEEFEKFQAGTNFAAWAVRVAHFQVLTWRKRVSRSRLVFDQRVIDTLAEEPIWTDEQFEDRQRALAECVSELPDNSRDLLRQCDVKGSKAKDVAADLKRTPAAVYKALERIRLALHTCIQRKLAQKPA
jgi:RNA polymerase sigma-70 factor, ECF subfamily